MSASNSTTDCSFPHASPPQCTETLADYFQSFYFWFTIAYASLSGCLSLFCAIQAVVFIRAKGLFRVEGNIAVQRSILLLLCLICVTFIIRSFGTISHHDVMLCHPQPLD
jgi:hypothetical protein